jgi:hypothetical protein
MATVNIIDAHYVKFSNITIDVNEKHADGLWIGGDDWSGSRKIQNNEHHITISNVKVLDVGDGTTYQNGILIRTDNNNISNIELLNVTVDGVADQGIALYPQRSIWASLHEISNITIRNCIIRNYGERDSDASSAIVITNKSTNVAVEYCLIEPGKISHGRGIVISNNEPLSAYYPTGIKIRNNLIIGVEQEAIYFTDGLSMTAGIYNNIILGSGHGAVFISGWAQPDYTSAVIRIYNNTLYNNGVYAVQTNSPITGGPTIELKNNIIYDARDGLAINDRAGILGSHSNNLMYNQAGYKAQLVKIGSKTYTLSTIKTWEPTIQIGDPNFLDPSKPPAYINDVIGPDKSGLAIQFNSPARDNGIDLGTAMSTAINLITRPQGSKWDIGAYEISEPNISIAPHESANKHRIVLIVRAPDLLLGQPGE